MSRVVITTWGSLGDLYPYLALGLGLRSRGHDVVIGTCPGYRSLIESAGLEFHPIGPDCDWLQDEKLVRWYSHPRFGLLRVGQGLLMPSLRDAYAATYAAAQGADLLVSMMACYATRLVAEKANIPWVSAVHIPLGFFSAHDPSVLEISPFLSRKLRPLGPLFWKPVLGLGKLVSRPLAREWYRLRAELALPATHEGNPLSDSHSPWLVLALFSKQIADKQPDWPAQTIVTGHPFHSSMGSCDPLPTLRHFLANGSPPVVFTLGSAVFTSAGRFYEESGAAVRALGRRAVFVVGQRERIRLPSHGEDILVVDYVPFDELFPQAAAVVHHGGIGTTTLAMRAGCPMLIVPCAWDQPDNAERARRLGISLTIPKGTYTEKSATKTLRRLLDDPSYAERAARIGEQVQQEDGVRTACDALESLLTRIG